ncbi:unnamed protein product, partial [Rotaria sp. Silwood2]
MISVVFYNRLKKLLKHCEDHRPTLHRVIPLRQCLINKCEISEEDSTAVTELKLFLAHRMKANWLITTEHRLATILHPKLKNFEYCYDEKENTISALKLAFDKCQLNISLSSSYLSNSNQLMSSSSSNIETSTVTLKSKNLLTQCFDTIVKTDVEVPKPRQEINDYLNFEFSYSYDNKYYED